MNKEKAAMMNLKSGPRPTTRSRDVVTSIIDALGASVKIMEDEY